MEYRSCCGLVFILVALFSPIQSESIVKAEEKSEDVIARTKQGESLYLEQEDLKPKIAIPTCPYGEPLIYRRCSFDQYCPCGYECNKFTGRCCPSDPDDICNGGELWKGKCGPKNYPCPCGQQCQNHPAKGYVVCCPDGHCPERECKYGYPLENRVCGYGKVKSCPTGYECNNHRCCPIKHMPGMCEIGEPVPGDCKKCPAWYKCTGSWCCSTVKCTIGQPLPGRSCGGLLGLRCPINYSCTYRRTYPPVADALGYCCRSLIRKIDTIAKDEVASKA